MAILEQFQWKSPYIIIWSRWHHCRDMVSGKWLIQFILIPSEISPSKFWIKPPDNNMKTRISTPLANRISSKNTQKNQLQTAWKTKGITPSKNFIYNKFYTRKNQKLNVSLPIKIKWKQTSLTQSDVLKWNLTYFKNPKVLKKRLSNLKFQTIKSRFQK